MMRLWALPTVAVALACAHPASRATPGPDSVARAGPSSHDASAALLGFEQRRAQGVGQFIAPADLRKFDQLPLAAVLGGIPELHVVACQNGAYVAKGPGDISECGGPAPLGLRSTDPNHVEPFAAAGCWVTVYTDGTRTYDPRAGSRPTDVSHMKVSQFAGIEYYSGTVTVPSVFKASANPCGTLVLWTRESFGAAP